MLSREYFDKPVKIVHSAFVRNEEHCIEKMLESILPYVDGSYILIDDRTTDNTQAIAERMGCITKPIKFENFSKTKNTLLKWLNDKTDFTMGLAPDETIGPELGIRLRPMAQEFLHTNIDCVWFSRMHWHDLGMTNEANHDKWYPDWQARFLRVDFPRIHLRRYVHEIIQGVRGQKQVQLDIHHFNIPYKKMVGYDWDAMLESYEVLKKLDREERGENIWPT